MNLRHRIKFKPDKSAGFRQHGRTLMGYCPFILSMEIGRLSFTPKAFGREKNLWS